MRDNSTLAGLRQHEIRDKVQAYFKAQLDQYLDWLDRRGLSQNALADAREEMLDHESYVDMDSANPQWLPVARFKRTMQVSDAEWDASLPRISMELRKGRRDMLRAVLDAAERLDGYSYAETPAALLAPPAPALPASAPLGRAIEDFMDEHSPQWSREMQNKARAYLALLLEHFGPDRALAAITRHDAAELKKLVQALPANRNTRPETRDLTLQQAITVPGLKKISAKTVNSYIDTFRRFWDWAERHGHAPNKLFDGMKVKKAKHGDEGRKAYTPAQTAKMHTALTGNAPGLVRKDDFKWGALLGLYTGARLREIAQLDMGDIRQEGDIWYIDINADAPNKSLKTHAAKRRVPLHSELIRLGFLDWVATKPEGQRLFLSFSFNAKEGYGRNLGRWFNTVFLPGLGLKESGLVFHSLRHTMVTRLAQAGVPEQLYQEIVGHERQGVAQQVYFKEGHTLAQKQEGIERFRV
jgi:integrase